MPGAKRPTFRQLQEGEVEQLPTTTTTDKVLTTGPPIRPLIPSGSCYVACFFINEDKTKYISVGYYPPRDYQPLVE